VRGNGWPGKAKHHARHLLVASPTTPPAEHSTEHSFPESVLDPELDENKPRIIHTGTGMATLQQLQATCLGLLFSTQAHPVGFAKLQVKRDVSILTNKEEHLLLLYDKLEQVCLEQRILEAELSGVGIGATDEGDDENDAEGGDGQAPVEEKLRIAEEKLLQSKAKTAMKGRVVEMTLVTQPILKAVHLSSRSTAKEQ
jgi:hypothetical protein